MRGNEFLDVIGMIDASYIEAADAPMIRHRKNRQIKKLIIIAACITLVLSSCLGIYAYAAEVKEYNAALDFFSEYELPLDGLTRKEIKIVYRDIITESFSYSKTADVIKKSLTAEQLVGYELPLDDPTPEDVENLWNYKNYIREFLLTDSDGVRYSYGMDCDENSEFKCSYLEKYVNDNMTWRTEISDFVMSGYNVMSDCVMIYGYNHHTSSEETVYPYIAKIAENGSVIWKHKFDNGFERETVEVVLQNEDGSYAVISRGDLSYFCLSQYTTEGERVFFKKNEVGNYGIRNAVTFGDGYAVQLWNNIENETAKIVKVDKQGNLTDGFSYALDDAYYTVTDMIEFNGKLYLSAYAVPKLEDESESAGGRYDIAAVLNYMHDKGIMKISSEELTPLVRNNFAAILMVCDSISGEAKEFYSVKGALGGALSLSGAKTLFWDVESITTTFYSPYTSSFTIGGTCNVFRYTFGVNGVLLNQSKTDMITGFAR